MDDASRLRFNQDIDYLIWRAEIHRQSPAEIQQALLKVLTTYYQILPDRDRPLLLMLYRNWKPRLGQLLQHHKRFDASMLSRFNRRSPGVGTVKDQHLQRPSDNLVAATPSAPMPLSQAG